uniref:Uncharacterized protein n=1 Tax=Meloidogyne enterolobii TaxID=390850 RepID=A0A6V7W0E2_MELEN|nr:unnamed protein product [Meloidogyne enterolobii]
MCSDGIFYYIFSPKLNKLFIYIFSVKTPPPLVTGVVAVLKISEYILTNVRIFSLDADMAYIYSLDTFK